MAVRADKIIDTFRTQDPDATGLIRLEHMHGVLKAISGSSDLSVQNLLKDYGKEHRGYIEYADFFVWLMGSHWDLVPSSSRLQTVYDIGDKLGAGAFGTVHLGKHRASGTLRAVKSIQKAKTEQQQALDNEIMLMKQVDHPNIVRIFEVFQDNNFVHLVMELCTGGELLDKLIEELGFSERQASFVMEQVLGAVSHLHAFSICHRDLKPQNFLIHEKGLPIDKCIVKVADFGLSRSVKDGKVLTSPVGSPAYTAPEVLKGSYVQTCDLWSCGVITYVLLTASLPFTGNNDADVLAKVIEGSYSLDGDAWRLVSEDAKDFVRNLMTVDPDARYNARQALEHRWIRLTASSARDTAFGPEHLDNMRAFCRKNRLKKASMHAIAQRLRPGDILELQKIFNDADKSKDGLVTYKDLEEAISSLQTEGSHPVPSPAGMKILAADLDTDRDGFINYTEFLAAAMDKRHYLEERVCHEVFQIFDRDGSGCISRKELLQVLCNTDVETVLGSVAISRVMAQCDTNNDGVIDFQEFMTMLRA